MKKLTILLTGLIVTVGNSQETRKETVIEDGIENNLTISMTGMYDGTESKKAKKYYDKAFDFGKAGDNKNAEIYYLKAIEEDSSFVEAYDNLGRVYRSVGNYEEAIKKYKKSIEIYPLGQMAHQNLAVVYGIQKDYENALNEYNTLLKIDETDPESYFGLANCYMMLGKFDEALPNAKKALKIYNQTGSGHISDGYYLIGLIYYYSGNKESAKENLILAKDNGAKISSKFEEEFQI